MKNLLIASGLMLTAVFTACDNKENKSADMTVEESATSSSMDAPVDTNQQASTDAMIQGDTGTVISIPDAASAPVMQVQQGNGGLNPAHGEPGHRCDIAVGAPLNSAPAQPATISSSPSQAPDLTIPAPSSTPAPVMSAQPSSGPTAPGMNPPHGEPGHDCSIPVGSPLKK